jgi:hypothetical protein
MKAEPIIAKCSNCKTEQEVSSHTVQCIKCGGIWSLNRFIELDRGADYPNERPDQTKRKYAFIKEQDGQI